MAELQAAAGISAVFRDARVKRVQRADESEVIGMARFEWDDDA